MVLSLLLLAPLGNDSFSAQSKARRIAFLLASGKTVKAWEICRKLVDSQDPLLPDERNECAETQLEYLMLFPDELDIQRLDLHWQAWPGTPAATKSRLMSARLQLRHAQQSVIPEERDAILAKLVDEFGDTDTGRDALAFIWELTRAEGTSEAVNGFLRRYPDAPQYQQARARLMDLVWQETQEQNTAAAWRRLQQAYPGHPRAIEARRRELAMAFQEAQAVDTVAAWEYFMTAYPDHPRMDSARQLHVEAVFRQAQAQGPEALLAALREHPDHPRAALFQEEAYRQLVKVEICAGEPDQPTWSPQETRSSPSLVIPMAVSRFRVRFPALGPEAAGDSSAEAAMVERSAHLALVRSGRFVDFTVGYSAALRAMGLDSSSSLERATVEWTSTGSDTMEALLSEPLCMVQQEGVAADDLWYAVVVRLGRTELVYPFTVVPRCQGS